MMKFAEQNFHFSIFGRNLYDGGTRVPLLFSPEHSASALYLQPLKICPILLEKTEIFIHRAFYLNSMPNGRTIRTQRLGAISGGPKNSKF
jgi:hypothetical protein